MGLTPCELEITGGLGERAGEMEAELRNLVGVNSYTANREGVDRVGGLLAAALEELGFRVGEVVSGRLGRSLVARREAPESHRLLLLGHLDTVHPPEGGFQELEEDPGDAARRRGPGAADMKGGLVVMLEALRALHRAGALEGRHLTVVLNADEEVGSPTSADLVRGEAAEAHLCLGFEAGRPGPEGSSTFVTSRMGFGRLKLLATGRAAHAGVDRGQGASAVGELARKVITLEDLSDPAAGVSVLVGRFQGGTAANTVPEEATLEVDYRYPDTDTGAELEDDLMRAASRNHLRDAGGRSLVSTRILEHVRRPPMPRTEAVGRMAARIVEAGRDLGLDLQEEHRGGSSDAALAAEMGCPAVCGLGAVGDAFHTTSEWVQLASLPQRAALAALVAERFYHL